jgi:hypothetical protein
MKLTGPLRGRNYKNGKLVKKPKAKKADPDEKKHLKSGDYILASSSGWFEHGNLVAHVFVPYGEKKLAVEIFKTDSSMDDEDVLGECSVEQP